MKDTILLFAGALLGWLMTAFLYPLARPAEALSRRVWKIRPVDAWVEQDPSNIWAGTPPWVGASYWFPGLIATAPPELATEWWGWARERSGQDAGQTTLKVTVQARDGISLIIEGVKLHVRAHRPVPEGGVVARARVGGASMNPRRIEINLDWNGVGSMSWLDRDEHLAGPPSFTLAPGEIEQFHVWAQTREGYHEWELELLMVIDGHRHSQMINDGGKPFVTIGTTGQRVLAWNGSTWTDEETFSG
ncbi:hypothetical protein ACFYNO_24965 [Kitasatospora sp. NPDC006697]|uniref:hypothetical protein n=1 Tax=Kitasatospora sp. NPDC006697 TaxID=3364020 RepID=UPI00367EACED